MRSPVAWIFDLAGFSAMSDLDTLRVDTLLKTHFPGGNQSTIEGSSFDSFIFDVLGGNFKLL